MILKAIHYKKTTQSMEANPPHSQRYTERTRLRRDGDSHCNYNTPDDHQYGSATSQYTWCAEAFVGTRWGNDYQSSASCWISPQGCRKTCRVQDIPSVHSSYRPVGLCSAIFKQS